MKKLFQKIKNKLKGFVHYEHTRQSINTSRSIEYNNFNGKISLKLNGKKIDPESPQGKKLIKELGVKTEDLNKMVGKFEDTIKDIDTINWLKEFKFKL